MQNNLNARRKSNSFEFYSPQNTQFQTTQSSQELFQSKVNVLQNKVSNFIQDYLRSNYVSNIYAEEDLTRTTLQLEVKPNTRKMKVQPKLYIIPNNQYCQGVRNLKLLQSFQLFVIKENKDNIFHYLKFLKGKADKKQCKSIKDTLYHINDFFQTIQKQIEEHFSSFNVNPQLGLLMIQQFVNSANFYNIQILTITRILLKIFLMKFINELNENKRRNFKNTKETNLLTFLKFYDLVKRDLFQIEQLISKNNQSWFINPKVFQVPKDSDFFNFLKTQIVNNQQNNGFNKMFNQLIISKHLTIKNYTKLLETINQEFDGQFKNDVLLKGCLIKEDYLTHTRSNSTPNIFANYSPNQSYDSDSENSIYEDQLPYNASLQKIIQDVEYDSKCKTNSFFSENETLPSFNYEEFEEQAIVPNGGTFFDKFQYNLLIDEMSSRC